MTLSNEQRAHDLAIAFINVSMQEKNLKLAIGLHLKQQEDTHDPINFSFLTKNTDTYTLYKEKYTQYLAELEKDFK